MSTPLEIVTRLPQLAPRALDSNKGSFGKVLVVAGSRGMSGAAVLCGSAVLRGGAGLVRVAVPEGIQSVVAAGNPCYLTAGLAQDSEGRLAKGAEAALLQLIEGTDVLAIGPGLGRSPAITDLVRSLLQEVRVPIVLDADGLNALEGRTDVLRTRQSPTVLTPHPGEFARLLESDVPTVQARREELAVAFAAREEVVLLLKGHRTIVTDGHRIYHNQTGNPGMATGGTGDVLTGLIAALIGQGLPPFDAAQLGACWHGLAGDLAAQRWGEVCLVASDLLDCLPEALSRCR